MKHEAQHLSELTQGLRGELRLIGELCEALARQRADIVRDDDGAMRAAAREVGGIVRALEQAREHRVRLVAAITGDERFPLARVEEHTSGPLPETFVRARAALRAAGQRAVADVRACQALVHCALLVTSRGSGPSVS